VKRVPVDEEYIKMLRDEVLGFLDEVAATVNELQSLYGKPAEFAVKGGEYVAAG